MAEYANIAINKSPELAEKFDLAICLTCEIVMPFTKANQADLIQWARIHGEAQGVDDAKHYVSIPFSIYERKGK